jgi:N-acetylglucosamine-6-sulfatase
MTNSAYSTDVLKRNVQDFIGASAAQGKPFFAYVAPYAPHAPATPAPRDLHTFDPEKAPRLPSFNEANVSDKPPWIQSLRRFSSDDIANIDQRHEDRVESLQAVDDLVAAVVGTLGQQGVLSNTYIVFTSDNGWHHGEHRVQRGKGRPYEESVRVPLLIRGPGVAAGSSTGKLVLNTDYLPTFMEVAGAQTPPTSMSVLCFLSSRGAQRPPGGRPSCLRVVNSVQTPRFPLTVTTTPSVRAPVSTLSMKEASANSMILAQALIPTS